MPNLNQQASFEAWAKEHGYNTKLRNDAESADTYFNYETEQRWIVWQAARRQHGSAAQAGASDCRATCDVCFDEVGNEWPCVKDKARARIATPPVADAEMLMEVLRVVREYPDFDGGTLFGQMIDEALAGKRPAALDTIDRFAAVAALSRLNGEKK